MIQKEQNLKKTNQYNLEDRTFAFAKNIRELVKKIPKNISNNEDAKQLVRSSGSVGANYIEANESLGKKDFIMKLKISRKEAKESKFWLELLDVGGVLKKERDILVGESKELLLIFSAIIKKLEY